MDAWAPMGNPLSTRSGRWGTGAHIPPEVMGHVARLRTSAVDWTSFYVDGEHWMVAKLYKDATRTDLVAARIEYSEEWEKP